MVRQAKAQDEPIITAIGRKPAPMVVDFTAQIETKRRIEDGFNRVYFRKEV